MKAPVPCSALGGDQIEDSERRHIDSINESAKRWLQRADKQYGRVWRRIVRASSRPKTDTDVEVDHQASQRVAMAIQKIAYAHVHLQFLAGRLSADSAGGARATTTSAVVTSFSTSAPPSPWSSASPVPLSAHRAYLEWVLVLARKLSQALARKASESDDPSDILSCHLMDDPEYRLPGLDGDLIRRINKRPIHLAYFDDPEGGKWRVEAIARQLGEAVDRLLRDLEHTHPDRAGELRRQIARFESELSEAG